MINIIKNELIKLFYRRKLLIIIIAMAIVTLGSLSLLYFDSGKNRVEKDISHLNHLKEQSTNLNDSKEKDDINNRIDSLQKSIDNYNMLNDENFNWREYLENSNKMLEKYDNDTTNTEIKINKYLIDNNIKPSSDYSLDSNKFLSYYISILGNSILFVIIALTISDNISSEYSKETIQILLLRPVEKFKLLLGKLLSSCIIVIGVVLSFDLIAYILSGLIWSFGNIKSPVLIAAKFTNSDTLNTAYNQFISPIKNTTSFMSSGELILKSVFLQLLYVICCVCFCILISLLFKNNSTSTIISILLAVVSIIIPSLNAYRDIIRNFYGIFSFLGDSISIVDGEIITHTGAYFLRFPSAILILTSWIIFFFILIYLFRNRLKSN